MNQLLATLSEVSKALEAKGLEFALTGGLVASLYRDQPRATNDLDICILSGAKAESQKLGERILKDLGFQVGFARRSDLQRKPQMNKKQSPVVMLVGRDQKQEKTGIDFLLETMPWVEEAVARAQEFKIDFGSGPLPTVTIEDFVLSKAFAIQDNPSRYKDLDDLQSIFRNPKSEFDETYLASRFIRYKLGFPRDLEKEAPDFLRVISKKNR